MEITRKRVRPELQEFLTDICLTCGGIGWVFSPETVTTRIDRELRRAHDHASELTISVHPAVAAYIHKDEKQIKSMLERENHCILHIVEDDELDQDEYGFSPELSTRSKPMDD